MKQVIIFRNDLKMSSGKMIAQGAHASIGAVDRAPHADYVKWWNEGMKKVTLVCDNEKELIALAEKFLEAELPHFLVTDAGSTEIPPGTLTCVGFGPCEDKKIDWITGHLRLL